MKHIAVAEYGHAVGITGSRLTIKEKGSIIHEYALSRVKSVLIAKDGVSISSNCVTALTARGVKLFFSDFKGEIVSCLYNVYSHGSVGVRQKQFDFISSPEAKQLAKTLILGKIKAQRAVLKYFSKYKTEDNIQQRILLQSTAESIRNIFNNLRQNNFYAKENWKEILMGYEGTVARLYWRALVQCNYFPQDFRGRTGRRARDVVNQSLNYGYAILSTVIMNAMINAGLELYAGVLHSNVPGKPSLLLDVIEEYRALIVDRAIIKMRFILKEKKELDVSIKKRIIQEIYDSLSRKHLYNGRNIRLESIIQRQMYKLAAAFCSGKQYKSVNFKW